MTVNHQWHERFPIEAAPIRKNAMLSHLRPDNQNQLQGIGTIDWTDHQTLKLLQQERDKTLRITNYLEALYARLLVAAHGRSSVATIGETE